MKLVPMHHTPQSCHWSVQTLLMPRPYWLSANDASWCCWNDRQIVVLDSTDVCRACQVWKPCDSDSGRLEPIPRQGAMPFREP